MKMKKLVNESEEPRMDEYWFLPDGSTLYANGDYGDKTHEDHVIEAIITKILPLFGYDEEWEGGATDFRIYLNDNIFPEMYGDDEDDPYERLKADLLKHNTFRNQKEIDAAFSTFSGHGDDAREFAIEYWNWIRVAGFNAEVRSLNEETFKRIGEGMLDLLFEDGFEDLKQLNQISVKVSTYKASGNNTRKITIGELVDGEKGAGNSQLEVPNAGKDSINRLDKSIANPYYKHFGDSFDVVYDNIMKLLQESRINR